MPSDAEILTRARQVVEDAFVGVLSTVRPDGTPTARYMGAAPLTDELHKIYTMTGATTRKLGEIASNPSVTWLYASPHFAEVVTLRGKAQVLESPIVAQQIWDRLADCARAYSLNALSNEENLDYVVIESDIEEIEFLCPRMGIVVPKIIKL